MWDIEKSFNIWPRLCAFFKYKDYQHVTSIIKLLTLWKLLFVVVITYFFWLNCRQEVLFHCFGHRDQISNTNLLLFWTLELIMWVDHATFIKFSHLPVTFLEQYLKVHVLCIIDRACYSRSRWLGYWPSPFSCNFMGGEEVKVYKDEQGNKYPAIWTNQALLIKDYLNGQKKLSFNWTRAGGDYEPSRSILPAALVHCSWLWNQPYFYDKMTCWVSLFSLFRYVVQPKNQLLLV